MAIGIAVVADDQNLILASDEPANANRNDFDESVIEFGLPNGWYGLAAGDGPVIRGLHAFLDESFELIDDAQDEDDVLRTIHRALRNYKKFLIDIELKAEYGLNYEEFREVSHLISEEKHSAEIARVRDLAFDAELIIGGFVESEDGALKPVLLTVEPEWKV